MKINIGKFLEHLLDQVKTFWDKLKKEEKKYLPWAISVVNTFKTVEDMPFMDRIAQALGKEKGGDILTKVRLATTKTALALDILQAAEVKFSNDEDKVLYIVSKVKLGSDEQKATFWHSWAANLIHALSDGKVTLGEAFMLAEPLYRGEIA